jgi:hypothetical protein
MQPARIKPHAKEHTNNLVQRLTLGVKEQKRKPQKTVSPLGPRRSSQGRQTREETEGGGFATMCEGHQTHRRRQTEERNRQSSSLEAVGVWTSLGGSLLSEWTHPFTGEPIPRSRSTGLGGILFSDRTQPVTGEPIPRSSITSTKQPPNKQTNTLELDRSRKCRLQSCSKKC